MFRFGSQFLDTTLGAINTAVLIASSLTMAIGVTMAQQNRRRELIICLVLTLMGAMGFLVIKYFEYSHKFHEGYFPGIRFYERPHQSGTWDEALGVAGITATPIDTSRTAATASDLGLPSELPVETSTVGPPSDAPAGLNVVVLQEMEAQRGEGNQDSVIGVIEEEVREHDAGANEHSEVVHPLQDPNRPANAHMFFNIYFMMTGLHGIHVILGGLVIIWLIINTARGKFSSEYFTPVDLGGLYWHVVDLIWIFLFPLFYLI